jgi:oxygen-independent coproporphyrinogen III oxidase
MKQREEMMRAMEGELIKNEELRIRNEEKKIETIYFGGGTPSLLSNEELKRLLGAVYKNYQVTSDAEITLEANPDDITAKKLEEWKAAGINRLSIWIQSFHEEDLKWMNRAHSAKQAMECIKLTQVAGFDNYSIDLIFGTPTLSDEGWKRNLEIVKELAPAHVSSYALTVEPRTALAKMIEMNKKENVENEKQANQFLMLMDAMEGMGYEHYEISNFAKSSIAKNAEDSQSTQSKFRSRHNSSYWKGIPYVGIGPSAHSYDGRKRKWNVSNNALYIKALAIKNEVLRIKNAEEGILLYEEEILTDKQRLNEYIMISLRTMEGLDIERVKREFGEGESQKIKVKSEKYIESGKLIISGDRMILTREGKLFADGIAADIFEA